MSKLFSITIFTICFAICNSQTDISKSDILKDGTVFTYEFVKLHEERGFGSVKIVENDASGDTFKVLLVKTEDGFLIKNQYKDDEVSDTNLLKTDNLITSNTYAGFMDVVLNTDDRSTLCLSEKQFNNSVITVVPESDETNYKYIKGVTKSFYFMLNGEKVNAKSMFYNTKKDNETMIKSVGFLDNRDLPLQTHQYYILDYRKFDGFAFRLVSIDTKD